jgi:tryptophan 2,3-dioxygenase
MRAGPGPKPVIAMRIALPIFKKIKKAAARNGLTMSEEMARRIAKSFETEDVVSEVRAAIQDVYDDRDHWQEQYRLLVAAVAQDYAHLMRTPPAKEAANQ